MPEAGSSNQLLERSPDNAATHPVRAPAQGGHRSEHRRHGHDAKLFPGQHLTVELSNKQGRDTEVQDVALGIQGKAFGCAE